MSKLLYAKPVVALKRLAIQMLTSEPVGWLIRTVLNNKIPHYSRVVYTDNPQVRSKMVGYLFFKAYESAEIRYINKYLLKEYPVVELGSSLGVVAMQVTAKTAQPVYSVEANPELIPVIQQNLQGNQIRNCQVFNHIIANSTEQFYFVPGKINTGGYITVEPGKAGIPVPAVSLSDFLKARNLDTYILVCDIEGAEIFIFKEDAAALQNCRQLIIELHETSYQGKTYEVKDLVQLIEALGFRCVEGYGGNYVFERP